MSEFTMTEPAIIVHGGADDKVSELLEAHEAGCRHAAEAGLQILYQRGAAEDAVEAALLILEDDVAFDAGRGSFLNQDGVVELDAAFMEGALLKAGAVACVRDIANPIHLARLVMESEYVLVVGEGASRFAVQNGMVRCRPEHLIVHRESASCGVHRGQPQPEEPGGFGDTVGAIALDSRGHLAAGLSTGGRRGKLPGRVGDVPCIGAGLYAVDSLGAAASTGHGEKIMRVVLAKHAVDQLETGKHPRDVAVEAIDLLWQRVSGRGGVIVVDAQGRLGWAFSTAYMSRAWSSNGSILSAIRPDYGGGEKGSAQ